MWLNWQKNGKYCRFCGYAILRYPCANCDMGKEPKG